MKYLFFLFMFCTAGLLYPAISYSQNVQVTKMDGTTFRIHKEGDVRNMFLDFYGNNIVRIFQDSAGKEMRIPFAKPQAKILVENHRKEVSNLSYKTENNSTVISTSEIKVIINNVTGTFQIADLKRAKIVVDEITPVKFEKENSTIFLRENSDEYFFGGGVQNGRFSHKGKKIAIVNENEWTNGGVSSPAPFYWSTGGYAFMWYTFKKGNYDFGSKNNNTVTLTHQTDYLDVFFMIDKTPAELLNDYYQLTGNPVLIPKFGFYEGHLNAYNRDYWKEVPAGEGILFEDGKYYKESQKDNGGIRESLNGELNNYQFSARAVVDRYQRNDMPLGWILPNDGYGAGYGQTSTLDSNILNLKSFGDYARSKGVQIGLWTQSNLYPDPKVKPLLQRDLTKEVGEAGVRVLKTDVAWVGDGYSFGLHGIADASAIMKRDGNDARPFIITLDGWAGTQRYGAIWSGDQTGGNWEYIRFHIPTYIGAGLSGLSNITSDMDGIFGGKNPVINVRDFEWRTFSPMQLNMDGWGSNPKYPFIFGEPFTSINRTYLKLKSELLPYTYSLAHNAVDGLPMIRAMFLEEPNSYTLGNNSQYQFMYGPWFLIAPIYKNTKSDTLGNDIRNNIYLPPGKWIDYFTGDEYDGNRILNNFSAPLWKLPVFVKRGAVIPMANPNNDVSQIDTHRRIYEFYPYGKSGFTQYDDDGTTLKYESGEFTTTNIESEQTGSTATITIQPTHGGFNGFEKMKSTELRINVTEKPKTVSLRINNKNIRLNEIQSPDKLKETPESFFYNSKPNLNRFSTKGSSFEKVPIIKNSVLYVNISAFDITKTKIELMLTGFEYSTTNHLLNKTGAVSFPSHFSVSDTNITAYTVSPAWNKVSLADYYEIEFENMLYTGIRDTSFIFENLKPSTTYHFKLRSVNKSGVSAWTELTVNTKIDPLTYAIHGIKAKLNVRSQREEPLKNFFDFDESSMWHTRWDTTATPFELVLDLRKIEKIDKMEYLPRQSGSNGIWEKGSVSYSTDKSNWSQPLNFDWKPDNTKKDFRFDNNPEVRYIKIDVTEAKGKFGSGRELYIFRVPGSDK